MFDLPFPFPCVLSELDSGVYSVNIDAENQLVIVSGRVDSATLIKKLERSGKHAELWSPSSYQKPNEGQANFITGDNCGVNGRNASKIEHIFPTFLANDLQEHWNLQNYLNQNNIGASPEGGAIDRNSMAATMVKNTNMGDYIDTLAMEADMKMNFSERNGYDNEIPPPMMNNMQRRDQYNG
ncbi:Heavy metal-associated domain containing protein [Melia azedarach]|uniref:Heavy metal-associated domain containing protein n=1 Tax=Melia azedarach TaxID=155640 RepID=A0ACC1X8G9_MELAZ|nr:Heavy metal-associated domain containing protein [Melia azedarach]